MCKIKLYEPLRTGDGIEIWSKPHVGTGVNKKGEKGEIITLNIEGKINKGDRVFKTFDKDLNDRLKKSYQKIERKLEVNVNVKVNRNESLIEISDYGIIVRGQGGEKAQNQPMSAKDIISRLSKTGDTPFLFMFNNCNIEDNIYIPVSVLNSLRREACDRLEKHIIKAYEREKVKTVYEESDFKQRENIVVTAKVRTFPQLEACVNAGVKRIYCELNSDTKKAYELCSKKGIEMYIAMPHIAKEGCQKIADSHKDCDGYLIRSYGIINTDKPVIADYSLNIFNRAGINEIRNIFNCNVVTLSPELNIREIKQIADENCEIVVYGRLPLMTTNQCPAGLYDGNKGMGKYCKLRNKEGNYKLIDRTKTEFPVIRDCNECIAFILNSAPVYILNKAEDLRRSGGFMRMEFTVEGYEETLDIAIEHINVLEKGNVPTDKKIFNGEVTGGHFNRGVL